MSAPDPKLHDPPDPGQLVEAVRQFLEHEVQQATDGQVRFLVRVATNTLSVVERQLALGPGQQSAHAERLAGLGYASDDELVEAIRRGELDQRFDEILAVLRQAVWDKVAIVNPRYVGSARDPFDRAPEPPLDL
jgi:uncharacterized protein DUF6285